jgi:type I restriction-modification system DNA methylase subunit
MNPIEQVEAKIQELSVYSKTKSDKHGEVFTPVELINEMLDQLPNEVWSDPNKTWFDPAAGNGNFHIQVLKRLFNGLKNEFPSPTERLKHIIENQLYFGEYQSESASNIRILFSFNNRFKVNLYEGDVLNMPDDYFDNK